MARNPCFASFLLAVGLVFLVGHAVSLQAAPELQVKGFHLELLADLSDIGPNTGAFQLLLNTDEKDGNNPEFPRGLYVSSGPGPKGGNAIIHIEGPFKKSVIPLSFVPGSIVFAPTSHGGGMLIHETNTARIHRLTPDGKVELYPEGATDQEGAGAREQRAKIGSLDFMNLINPGWDDDKGRILVMRGLSGELAELSPSGSLTSLSQLKLPAVSADRGLTGAKALVGLSKTGQERFGAALMATTFSLDFSGEQLFVDKILSLSPQGDILNDEIASGLQSPGAITEGPGGDFGNDLFVGSFGACASRGFGGIDVVSPDGNVTAFLRGMDVADLTFEGHGSPEDLGAGAFWHLDPDGPNSEQPSLLVAEPARGGRAGRIWHITSETPDAPSLGFACSDVSPVLGPAGQTREFTVDATLTGAFPEGHGVRGWSIGVVADGADIIGVTLDGTDAGDLFNDGFQNHQLTSGEGNEGAVSGVALALTTHVELPAGTSTIARLALQSTFPTSGECRTVRLFYVNGLVGKGEPVKNTVTVENESLTSDLVSCALDLCGRGANWVSFDSNDDGEIDISDPLNLLGWLFRGNAEPECTEALDFNLDEAIDITDAIAGLAFLFVGGAPPEAGLGCQLFLTCPVSEHCR